MFAQGVESIVSDHLHYPRKQEAQPTSAKQRAARKQDPGGNFFSLLMRQFASY